MVPGGLVSQEHGLTTPGTDRLQPQLLRRLLRVLALVSARSFGYLIQITDREGHRSSD